MYKNEKNPLVTFVIPTHNRVSLIKDCLDSVLNQTYENVEVIVVNDNSVDSTNQVLQEYSNNNKNFKYFNNEGKGVGAARNIGIKKAQGTYIAFMDDDDVCEPFRIEKQMKPILDSNSFYNFVVSSFTIISPEGQVIKVNDYLKKTDSIGFTVRWLVKRDLLLEVGGFDIEQPNLEEVELFFRLKEKAKIFFSPLSVVNVREFPVSLTKDSTKMISGIKRLLELHSKKMGWYEENMWLIILSKKLLRLSKIMEFEKYFFQISNLHFPIQKSLLYITYKTNVWFPLRIYGRIYSNLEWFINRKNKFFNN